MHAPSTPDTLKAGAIITAVVWTAILVPAALALVLAIIGIGLVTVLRP